MMQSDAVTPAKKFWARVASSGRRPRLDHWHLEMGACRVTIHYSVGSLADSTGVEMRKVLLSIFGGLLAAALLISPAHAVKPVIVAEETIRFDGTPVVDPELSEACGFPVTVSTKGHIRVTEFRDQNGNTRLVTSHPSLSDTLTSPYTSIQTSDRGLDKFTDNPDGTLSIFGTGIHLRVKGQVYAIGLWRLTIDQTGELIDQEYHGRFDVLAPEIGETICSLLGP
jgi:hypothetical protein